MKIHTAIKKEVKKIRIARELYSRYLRMRKKISSYNTEKVFTEKFKHNKWGSPESLSGLGSELRQTKTVIAQLPALCSKYGINSFLDLPCGDFNWIKHVSPFFPNYIGSDIVPALIEDNNKKYSEYGRFTVLNLLKDPLPDADVLFCRDCLVHLSYADIRKAIANIRNSGIKYLLTTSYPEKTANHDIITGEWRPLNLTKAPFNFPAPLDVIIENSTEQEGRVKDKCLVLWLIKDLPDC
jgi:hypothetical protein